MFVTYSHHICSPYYIILTLITFGTNFVFHLGPLIWYHLKHKCDLNLTAKRLYRLSATRISACQL